MFNITLENKIQVNDVSIVNENDKIVWLMI